MTRFSPGDVVLVSVPFSDLASSKKRPAVVLSPTGYQDRYGDVLLLPLTSQDQRKPEWRVEAWREAGLLKPTWFKPILLTVGSSIILQRLGQLVPEDCSNVPFVLEYVIDSAFLPTAAAAFR